MAVARLEARISPKQKQIVERAAATKGVTLTDFVVASAYEAAVRTLEAQQTIELGQRDSMHFVEMLMHAPEPGERLRAAAERHSRATIR